MLLFLVAIVGVGGYMLGADQNQTITQQPIVPQATFVQSSLTPTSIPTLPPLVIPTNDPSITSNWKTYTDNKYGFSIKYPKNLVLEDRNIYINLELWGPTQRTQQGFHDGIQLGFYIGSLEGKALKEFVDAEVKKTEDSRGSSQVIEYPREIIVGGVNGYSHKTSGAGPFTNFYFSPKPNAYFRIIDGTQDPTNKGFKKTVDQILSTFKFTP